MTVQNNKNVARQRFASRSLIALAIAAAFPLQAMAQEAPAVEAAKPGQLETVIVTAQRRAENIKDVPMAITSIRGEALDVLTSGAQDIRLLAARAPSLNVESDYGRSFPRFYIRGLGNIDFDLNASQPVGLVYDDVVQESPILKGFPMFDMEQVEVLRGPQGTLFGRNSPAGVVKFDSVRPSFKTEGYLAAGIGNYGARNAEGAYNLPISDTVAARFSVQTQHRDDRVHNSQPTGSGTTDFEGYSDNSYRLQVLVQPNKDFSALFNYHERDMHGSATLFRANIIQKGTNNLVPGFDYDNYPTDGINQQDLNNKGGSMRLRWNLAGVTLHSITGYEKAKIFSRADVDGGYGAVYMPTMGPGYIPFAVETADALPHHRQLTQELRAESNGAGPLQWIGGLFYFNEKIQVDSYSYDTFAPGNPINSAYAVQNQLAKSYAAFGSVNYAVSDQFKLRAGLRYTKDEKDFTARRFDGANSSGPFNITKDSNNLSWDLSATYTLDKDTNLYARAATGYLSPSIQGRLSGPADKPSVADAEKNLSFEAGIKQDLFDKRARFSASVFHYRVKDMQLTAGSGAINLNQLINADKAIGKGVELEFMANLSDAWRMTVGGSYNHTEIDDPNVFVATCGNAQNTPNSGCTPTGKPGPFPNTALLNGNPLPRASKWISNATLRYQVPLGSGEFFAYTDWAYRSKYNFFLDTAPEYSGKSLLEGGLRTGFKWSNYELAVFSRNITNRVQVVGAIAFDNLTGITNEPRTFGGQFKATF